MTDEGLVFGVFTEQCFDSFKEGNFSQFAEDGCPSFVLSKFLGYAIILGSAGLKLPQIQKLMASQSAKGLSVLALAIETLGFASTTAYFYHEKYPVSTYGESPVIVVQNIILFILIFRYSNSMDVVHIGALIIGVALFGFSLSNACPVILVQYLYSGQIFFLLGGRVPQIVKTFQEKSTGQLAFITAFLTLGGTLARLFTTLKEVDDLMALAIVVLGTLLNGIIVLQFLIYWNTPSKESPKAGANHVQTSQKDTRARKRKTRKG